MFYMVQRLDKCGTCTSAAPTTSGGSRDDLPGCATRLRASAKVLDSLGKWATAKRQPKRAFKMKSSRAKAPSAPLAFPRRAIPNEAVLSPRNTMLGRISWYRRSARTSLSARDPPNQHTSHPQPTTTNWKSKSLLQGEVDYEDNVASSQKVCHFGNAGLTPKC